MKKKPKPAGKLRAESDHHLEQVALAARARITQSVDSLLSEFACEFSAPRVAPRTEESNNSSLQESYERLKTAAQALTLWYSEEGFLASDGNPKPLRRTGKFSLTTLATTLAGDHLNAERLVQDLIDFGLVVKEGISYIPAKRSAVVGAPSALILAHATAAIVRLIETVAHNVSRGVPARYERHVADVRIHATDLPVFLRFVEQQGQYLIDAVDDWLSKREIKGSPRANEVTVGIGAFAWVDPSRRMTSRMPSRGGAIVPRK